MWFPLYFVWLMLFAFGLVRNLRKGDDNDTKDVVDQNNQNRSK